MPVEIGWLVENRVIHTRYYGDITEDDIRLQYDISTQMMGYSDAKRVHMITQISNITDYPPKLDTYTYDYSYRPQNAGLVVMVGEHNMIPYLSGVITRVMRLRVTYSGSIRDAIQHLIGRDPRLTPEVFDELPLIKDALVS